MLQAMTTCVGWRKSMDDSTTQSERDLFGGFASSAAHASRGRASAFLDGVDTLPAFRWYKAELRKLLNLQPGEAVLDIGCGNGTEACRLALDYPAVRVLGLDREAVLSEAARRSAEYGIDVEWLPGEADALPLPDGSVDACMTERVLKYVGDPALAVGEIVRVLRDGGRVACFELDVAATVFGGDPVAAGRVNELICSKISEPRMGRRLPTLFKRAGLTGVTYQPLAFHMPAALNDGVAYQPVRQAIAEGSLPRSMEAWLREQAEADEEGLFTIAWVGWLVSGVKSSHEDS
jgi:ubiquinone/menaquinone biosynthesis C-methylase UbiE